MVNIAMYEVDAAGVVYDDPLWWDAEVGTDLKFSREAYHFAQSKTLYNPGYITFTVTSALDPIGSSFTANFTEPNPKFELFPPVDFNKTFTGSNWEIIIYPKAHFNATSVTSLFRLYSLDENGIEQSEDFIVGNIDPIGAGYFTIPKAYTKVEVFAWSDLVPQSGEILGTYYDVPIGDGTNQI